MDKTKIYQLMEQSFNSLTVTHTEIVTLKTPILKVRVVAEGYASMTVPERVVLLNSLIRQYAPTLLEEFIISFEPLTPSEFTEWYDPHSDTKQSGSGKSEFAASGELET